MEILELFDTQYWDYTPKHFHEKLQENHNVRHSYNWVKLTLQCYVAFSLHRVVVCIAARENLARWLV